MEKISHFKKYKKRLHNEEQHIIEASFCVREENRNMYCYFCKKKKSEQWNKEPET